MRVAHAEWTTGLLGTGLVWLVLGFALCLTAP